MCPQGTECQSWPWLLTSWPKINRVPSLIIHNLHVKFESDWASTVVAIVSTGLKTECQSWPWPLTPWPKINRVLPLTIHNLHVKFESDWAKTVVAIVPTRSYTQSAKVDLDLWHRYPKSIGSLLSSWRNKVKCDGPTHPRTHALTKEPTHSPNHPRTATLLYPLQLCCEGITKQAIHKFDQVDLKNCYQ